MNKKRLKIALLLGAVLGVFCIIGVGYRLGFPGNEIFLIGMWYNRVIMGLVIGLADDIKFIVGGKNNVYLRGLFFGFMTTLAITLSSGIRDIPSFFAGLAYGVIIDWAATKYGG